jgi:ATP/maltotriose-dependent transcriptional regulator MalT
MRPDARLDETVGGPFNDTERAAVLVGFLAIMRGYSNRDIGHELGMSGETVKLHLKHIFRKLDVRSRAQAVACSRAWQFVRKVSSASEGDHQA